MPSLPSGLQHALGGESVWPTQTVKRRGGDSSSMTAWTFIAWPNDRISIARHLAGGRHDSIAQNVQSGAISRVRSHKCRPLSTFQFEQLQWWGQRPDRDTGGGSPEALSRFPPRLGTLRRQSISQRRTTSTAHAPAQNRAIEGQKLRLGGDALRAEPTYLLYLHSRCRRRLGSLDFDPASAQAPVARPAASSSSTALGLENGVVCNILW